MALAALATPPAQKPLWRHAFALALSVAMALVTLPLHGSLDLANIVMLDLLAVVLVAARWGRSPAVLCALSSVALFDFAHVPPRWSFAVGDLQYLVTLVVMLVVALTIGQLTHGLHRRAADAQAQADRTLALYGLARELAGEIGRAHV